MDAPAKGLVQKGVTVEFILSFLPRCQETALSYEVSCTLCAYLLLAARRYSAHSLSAGS
jgi:hypothetical protein